MSGIRTSGEGFSRSLSANGFKLIGVGAPATDISMNFAGFQVITAATVQAYVRKDGRGITKDSDHLTADGTDSGAAISFDAGYIDLGPYERIVCTSGLIKAFRG